MARHQRPAVSVAFAEATMSVFGGSKAMTKLARGIGDSVIFRCADGYGGQRSSRSALVRERLIACLLGGLLFAAGCGGTQLVPVTAEEIHARGTDTFEEPREQVFAACVAALRANGYSIAREDAAAGVILTERIQARTVAVTRAGEVFLRHYEIAVLGGPGQVVQVAATPLLFEAHAGPGGTTTPRQRGAETTWKLDEERAEWRRLFRAIQEHLTAQVSRERRGDDGTPDQR